MSGRILLSALLIGAPASIMAAPSSAPTAVPSPPVSGKLQLETANNDTVAPTGDGCTPLPAPTNTQIVYWPSEALSSRRVDAYEFAASWDPVPGATSYTVCYQQKTYSRTGGLEYYQDTCYTQPDTKLNNGAVFYDTGDNVTVTVRANSNDPCRRSAWSTATNVDALNGVTQICTDDKVNGEDGPPAFIFAGDTSENPQLIVAQVNRTVGDAGASRNSARLQWSLDPAFVKVNTDSQLEVCAGVTRDWAAEDQAQRTHYECVVVPSGAGGNGTADIELDVDDPLAVYISGRARPRGFCNQDSYDSVNKVTIANYHKVKVLNPVASAAAAIPEDLSYMSPDGYYIVTTSRTTPDQTIDVNYFTETLMGALDTWQLPLRTTPDGLLVHDTFVTPTDSVIVMTSSMAGQDASVAADIFIGTTSATAMGGAFNSFQPAREPEPTMYFKYSAKAESTRIESKAQKGMCLTLNPSDDGYQPPFIFDKCSASPQQLFRFDELVPGWTTPGSQWTTSEYDTVFGLNWIAA